MMLYNIVIQQTTIAIYHLRMLYNMIQKLSNTGC